MLGRLVNLVWQWIKRTKNGYFLALIPQAPRTPSPRDLRKHPEFENWGCSFLKCLSSACSLPGSVRGMKCQGSPALRELTLHADLNSACTGFQTPVLHNTAWLEGLTSSQPKYLTGCLSHFNNMAAAVIIEWGKCCGIDRQPCPSIKDSLWTNRKTLCNAAQAPSFSAVKEPMIEHTVT